MIEISGYCYENIIIFILQLLSERREHMRMTMSPGSMAAITGAGAASNMVSLPVTGSSQVRQTCCKFILLQPDAEKCKIHWVLYPLFTETKNSQSCIRTCVDRPLLNLSVSLRFSALCVGFGVVLGHNQYTYYKLEIISHMTP